LIIVINFNSRSLFFFNQKLSFYSTTIIEFEAESETEMAATHQRPYLDKICAGPHLMSQRPGIREDTIVLIPPLRHTGIKSELHEQEIPVTTPEGRITKLYRQHTKTRLQPIYRDHQELSNREILFKKGHKQFIDKVLVDMEDKKKAQHERQMKHWKSTKSNIGFSDSFNALQWSETRNSFRNDIAFANDQKNETLKQAPATAIITTEEDDYGADADFEHADMPRGRSASKEVRHLEEPQLSPSSPGISPKHQGIARSSSIISSTSSNSQHLSPGRKMRPYSRMSLFENMLDTVELPRSPSRRFG
jgi:hypothetical protein